MLARKSKKQRRPRNRKVSRVSKKRRQKKVQPKIELKLFEEVVQVPSNGFIHNVPVVVLAADRNEAILKVNNRKWWKKAGLRTSLEEFR